MTDQNPAPANDAPQDAPPRRLIGFTISVDAFNQLCGMLGAMPYAQVHGIFAHLDQVAKPVFIEHPARIVDAPEPKLPGEQTPTNEPTLN